MEVKVEIRGDMEDVNDLLQGRRAASVLFQLDEYLRQRVKYEESLAPEVREALCGVRSKLFELCQEHGFGFDD